jgi:benzoate-CoA ligase family protein
MGERFNAAEWLLDRHLLDGRGDRVAVEWTGGTLTYEALAGMSRRAGAHLRALDVREEERVALVANDEPGWIAYFLGAMRIGAVPVPLSTMLTAGELGWIVDDARARVVVVSGAYAPSLDEMRAKAADLERAVVLDDTPAESAVEVHRWADAPDGTDLAPARTTGDSPGFWLYTSGTTGSPKGAMHRHVDLQATADTYARTVLEIRPDDRCYSVAKLFFAYGLGNSLTFPLSVGATAVLNPAPPTPASVADLVTTYRPTLFFAVPGFYAALCDAGLPADTFASVRRAVSAGEAMPAPLHERVRDRFGLDVLDGIGTTEALHIFLSNQPGTARPGTSGIAVAGYEVKLVDDEGRDVTEPDVPGNLHVQGESVTTGYWCRTEATRNALIGPWLRTGDVYTRTADGFYQFLGRSSDVIKQGGIWVSPAEVETALVAHADVLEAAVVGSRDADGLEVVVAFVVARAGATLDLDELQAHCRSRMAAFKRPREIHVVDALPKTATGKVKRFELRNTLRGG